MSDGVWHEGAADRAKETGATLQRVLLSPPAGKAGMGGAANRMKYSKVGQLGRSAVERAGIFQAIEVAVRLSERSLGKPSLVTPCFTL